MAPAATGTSTPTAEAQSALHDFDFLIGKWNVHHRRLKERLAGSTEWQEFRGTSVVWKVLDGAGLVDDNALELPAGTYRAISIRSFDPEKLTWSIWWLDGRYPAGPLDPPVVGSFTNGIGTFLADDKHDGRPIVVRFMWARITPESCRWEQAFSTDGGETWETNWEMDFTRVR